ncbi:hypothetical protein HPG69_008733 [Diceros bicornis minor]|uniref:Uncharacterized protein n=1 Tax=Diceros bicornis minor TaxID=77932 RepID=A0A7J7FAT1_DICBM|nr:hypothetical protein HPG69_008733 [Diceros bicornis minor]
MKLTKSQKISFPLIIFKHCWSAEYILVLETCKSSIGKEQGSEGLISSPLSLIIWRTQQEKSNHQYWRGSLLDLKTRRRNMGFLPSEADAEILAVKFHTTAKIMKEKKANELKAICHSQCTDSIIVVHKNVLFLKRAFGKSLQGHTPEVFFLAYSLTAKLHYVKRWKIFMFIINFDWRKP